MRALWLLLAVMTIAAPSSALAEAPTGFDGFAFGTTRHTLIGNSRFVVHCRPAPETMRREGVGAQQGIRVTCPTYNFKDLGTMRAALLFSGRDRLVGYVLYVARDREADVRARITALYGTPTSETEGGRTLAWRWPSGTEASLTVFCLGSDGCLTVKAKATEKR
jgi:hypothetical protein